MGHVLFMLQYHLTGTLPRFPARTLKDLRSLKEHVLANLIKEGWPVPFEYARVTIVDNMAALDVDNVPKCILDALDGVLVVNDGRFRRLVVEQPWEARDESVIVKVTPITKPRRKKA